MPGVVFGLVITVAFVRLNGGNLGIRLSNAEPLTASDDALLDSLALGDCSRGTLFGDRPRRFNLAAPWPTVQIV